jgi:DNA-binding NarL/FixJ family response regulator
MPPLKRTHSRRAVLVVDHDTEHRTLVAGLLRRAGYPAVEAASGQEALEEVQLERPRLVVLDLDLPDASGYEIYRELRDTFGDSLPIVVLSARGADDPDHEVAALLLGADDYVAKPFVPDVLLARVRRLAGRGDLAGGVDEELTPREREVLNLLVEGRQEPDIARELFISTKTVAKHIEHILLKLDVHSRAQAVAVAARQGVGQPGHGGVEGTPDQVQADSQVDR